MAGRIRSISGYHRESLTSGWELASCPPGAVNHPHSAASLSWLPIQSLGTAAAALRSNGAWSLDDPAQRFDACDWWYRLRFNAATQLGSEPILGFDGLATVCDAWLNGEPLLSSSNMFVAHEVAVNTLLKTDNELILRFHSLDALLSVKRPRPRWRSPMIENQQLRWLRTTLLGRTPGWSPPAAAVGPWQPIWIETRPNFSIEISTLRAGLQGKGGFVDIDCSIKGAKPETIELRLRRDGTEHSVQLTNRHNSSLFTGRMQIDAVDLWWPHTHGEPALYDARLIINGHTEIDLGSVGFRTVELDRQDDGFALKINGVAMFCRGACWTPLDCVSLQSTSDDYDTAICQLKNAGMNMLRVGGTMIYEGDAFFDACDRHGILLWQEFMFANMDYPEGNAAFDATVELEARQLLRRLAGRPCLTVLCGNSEGEQQAAMWGATRERWSPSLFHKLLPEQTKALAPDVPYWPSSAHGGAFPHQGNAGTTSYYGVGAYRRPLTDARRAEICFATECLGFANIPEDQTLAAMPGGLALKVHHPQWKARSPRDLGAGWDFDDVRDHYLTEVFGQHTLDIRYSDHARYLELGRLATAEVMASAFREWRRKRSTCRGALIWFLRDLWPGAGWGIIDSKGLPKSPYYFLKRVLQPRSVFLSDEGTNGVFAHVANESAQPLQGHLEIALYRSGAIAIEPKRTAATIPARETQELPIAALFDGFMDFSFAYRFGPPAFDLVVATLWDEQNTVLARDFLFPTGACFTVEPDVGLIGNARPLADGDVELTVQSKRLARFVTVHTTGFDASDQYFHVAPGTQHVLRLRRCSSDIGFKAQLRAANSATSASIAI